MKSPVKDLVLRGNDPTGHGYYGAKRGNKKHKGVDIVTSPGDNILSPINGVVTRVGYPYSHTKKLTLVEIQGDVFRVKMMYCQLAEGVKIGQRIFIGDHVADAQDVAGFWGSNMINHLHLEVYKHGLLTDPEPLIT